MALDHTIHPILLCGGTGTRLWPLSRKSYPKQFAQLLGEDSLFQACARRLCGTGFAAPSLITAADFRFIVLEQLAALQIVPADVLIEPSPKDAGRRPDRARRAPCHLRHSPHPARNRLWLAGAVLPSRGRHHPAAAALLR